MHLTMNMDFSPGPTRDNVRRWRRLGLPSPGGSGHPGAALVSGHRCRRLPGRRCPARCHPPVGGYRPMVMSRQDQEGDHARYRRDEGGCQRSGRHFFRRPSAADQNGSQDRAAADAIDTADASHRRSEQDQQGQRNRPARPRIPFRGNRPRQREAIRRAAATPPRQQQKSKTCALGSNSTRITDPAMTPGSVPAMRNGAEQAAGLSLPPVPRYSAPETRPPRCTAGWSG